MSRITEMISFLKAEWGEPHEATHRGQKCPFLLACNFAAEPADGLEQFPLSISEDVREFWRTTRSATLFKDQQYGQWGIEMLEPVQALSETSHQLEERPRDFITSDLVLARFFGDSDLVVLACNPEQPEFGSVTIALPVDRRADWPVVAKSFGEFLSRLIDAQGDKYWEFRT
jgi:hypothetical protein